jgi:hypothetical protein
MREEKKEGMSGKFIPYRNFSPLLPYLLPPVKKRQELRHPRLIHV